MMFFLFVGITYGMAQSLNVSGTVLDEDGEPVIGAAIKVKGSTLGVLTDIDGKFQLSGLKEKSVLRVTYVGMLDKEVTASSKMKIVLQADVAELDEVIVTAFGTAKKSAFTGSAVVVDKEALSRKQVSNVLEGLIGEVAGLQMNPSTSPGSSSSILIRGEGSINAGTSPLIILDGMPYEGGWNNINPQDVESVTVLKDAASNALYGARGANGVIIITTKKGESGKTQISLNAKWGVNSRSTSDYDRITNPGQYYEMYYKALYNKYISDGQTASAAHILANQNLCGGTDVGGLGYNVYTVPDNEYLIGTNGKLNPNATLGRVVNVDGTNYTLTPDDWTDETYHSGLRQEYNLSISGGNKDLQSYASFGYLKDEGIIRSNDYERFSGKLRTTFQAKPWLLTGVNVAYTNANRKALATEDNELYTSSSSSSGSSYSSSSYLSGNVFSSAANMGPIYPMYARDENGNILYDSNGKVFDYGNGYYNTQSRPQSTGSNALCSSLVDFYQAKSNSINADAYADITFLNDFKFTFKAGTSVLDTRTNAGSNPYYGYYAQTGGALNVQNTRVTTFNVQQLLNWSKNLGKNNLSAMIGHEYYKYDYRYLSASKTGATDYFGNKELDGYLTSNSIPSSYATEYNTEGYFFRALYDYDTRYFASASFRRDASSRFDPSNRWGNFWSVGGAWIISKEEFFKADWVNNLKFKISYGEQGNDNIGYYRYADSYTVGTVNNSLSLVFNQKGNTDITWETNRNFNMGFEFDLFKNRLGGSIEYYCRTTSDMLMWFYVPNTLGYLGYYKNVGDLRNQGVEVSLNGSPIKKKDLTWNINLNLTYNHQEITKMPEENKSTTVEGHGGYISGTTNFIGEGLPINTWYIARYAGVSQDGLSQWYYTDDNGNQQVTTTYSNATKYLIKSSTPLFGGIGTNLTWKGFDVSVQFVYSLGGKGYDYTYAMMMTNPTTGSNGAGYALHKDLLNAWTTENTNTDVPRWQQNDENVGAISDRFLISNSYLSFQNAQIGYTLPKTLTNKYGISSLRVFAAGDNLYLWTKRKGYDPRTSSGYGTYSPMRVISGGISLQF
jgi:TonB-linked SusC/RagA family outer membrane protein